MYGIDEIKCKHYIDGAEVHGGLRIDIGDKRAVLLCALCADALKGRILQGAINQAVRFANPIQVGGVRR